MQPHSPLDSAVISVENEPDDDGDDSNGKPVDETGHILKTIFCIGPYIGSKDAPPIH